MLRNLPQDQPCGGKVKLALRPGHAAQLSDAGAVASGRAHKEKLMLIRSFYDRLIFSCEKDGYDTVLRLRLEDSETRAVLLQRCYVVKRPVLLVEVEADGDTNCSFVKSALIPHRNATGSIEVPAL